MAGVYRADGDVICTTKRILLQSFSEVNSAGGTLKVPLFQRRYCWPSKVIHKLFADIAKGATLQTIKLDRNSHIDQGHNIGLILLSNRKVLDGQQRLTTITLFIAALRDFVLSSDTSTNTTTTTTTARSPSPAAARLCAQINSMLFPKAVNIESVSAVQEGMEVEGCALTPTYFDRMSYFLATLPALTLKLKLKLKRDVDAENCVVAVYHEFLSLLQTESWQIEMTTKLGIVEELPSEGEFRVSSRQAVLLAKAMFASATRKLTFKVFEVEQTDVQTVFERLAFRDSSMCGMLSNAHPGIIAREEDLIRNLLLSYFPTEAEQTVVYFKYWVPIERTHSSTRLRVLFEAYVKQYEAKIETVKPHTNAQAPVSSMPSMNSIGPTKYNTTFGGKLHQGGAQHLEMGTLFPAYTKFRRMLENALVSDGIDLSEAPRSAKAEKLVEAFLQRIVTFASEMATSGAIME